MSLAGQLTPPGDPAYPVPARWQFGRPEAGGTVRLEREWLRWAPLDIVPQPFRFLLSLRAAPQLVWADAEIDLDLAVAEKGYGKRTTLEEYRLTNRGGKGIITMNVTDKVGRVVGVRMVRENEDVMLITDGGKVIRMPVRDISVIGRNTQGVRLIGLEEGEKVVAVAPLAEIEAEDADRDGEPPPEAPAA